jgi:hypothetical protein
MRIPKEYTDFLMNKTGVVGVGWGYKFKDGKRTDAKAIICSVVKKKPLSELSSSDTVPPTMGDGIRTDVVESGKIKALRTDHYRPCPAGMSIGHYSITAGTLGCYVTDGNNRIYTLSNNHVFAAVNKGSEGDVILQPGRADGGQVGRDNFGTLARFVPIVFGDEEPDCSIANFTIKILNKLAKLVKSNVKLVQKYVESPQNLADCAIAAVNPADVDNTVHEIGKIEGQGSAFLGQAIQKSGRTSGVTGGDVLQEGVVVDVEMGSGNVARFYDQVITNMGSAGGDSGSAVLDMDRNIVGLLFAGSDRVTVFNRIENVFSSLGVNLFYI